MFNPERDRQILEALCRYYVLNRAQLQRLFFPSKQGDRIARRRLSELLDEQLINRAQAEVVLHGTGSTAPVYYPAQKGCHYLRDYYNDDRWLLTPTQRPQTHHIFHWLAVSEFHIAFDEARSLQTDVECLGWLNEWDVANQDEQEPAKHYRLYTLIQQHPKLVCVPDAAMLIAVRGNSKVHYIEIDRATSGTRQVAAQKTLGYAAMSERGLHRRHFPNAPLDAFTVLMVTQNSRRRDSLKSEIAKKPGAEMWRFASITELTPDRLLFEPVWHRCDDQVVPLVKRGGPQ